MREGLEDLGVRTAVLTSSQSGADAVAAVNINDLNRALPRRLIFRLLGKLPLPRGFSLGWTVAEAIAQVSAERDLDLLEMEESFGAAWYTQQLLDIPVVVRLHGPHFLNGAALGLPLDDEFRRLDRAEHRCIAGAAGITSPSRDVLDRVREHYEIPLPDACVIPNPAPVVPIERRWRLEESDRKTILFVGRFDRHKGGDLVIDAFREVASVLPEVELLFVGPDRGFLDNLGRVHDLPGYLEMKLAPTVKARVQVTGALDAPRIEALRRQAFLTIVPSRYENFPLALVESLAYGCPTVGADAGGIPEILLGDQTGVLFRREDYSDLASKIIELFRNPERAADLGRRASNDVSVRFNATSLARRTLEYYDTITSRRGRSPAAFDLFRAAFLLTGLGRPLRPGSS